MKYLNNNAKKKKKSFWRDIHKLKSTQLLNGLLNRRRARI